MLELKKFSGILNKDDKEENILPAQHIDAVNIRFYGTESGLTAQNIVGNTLVSNGNLPEGNNEAIGAFYDGLKQRIFWFNWNSNGTHGIYRYDLQTFIITPVLVNFTNSQTDIFGFDLAFPIASINIIYTTEDDGDILTWVARNKRPKGLNLLQAENNIYGTNWLEEYLDIAKEPAQIPIKCAYENDSTVTVNNLRKKLLKFKYRYWYRDNEKSTWSEESEIPIPFNYTDPQIDTDPTKNCRIGCVVQTGDPSVVKVEIAAAESLGNVFSNYFSVVILDKGDLAIPDNDVYIYRFYNNEAYVFVDIVESNLLFDYVPDLANTQELLNGNVLVYGGITEGLDPIIPEVMIDTGTEYPLSIDCNNILSVTQYGFNGFREGENIKFIVLGTIRMGQTFQAQVSVGISNFVITYTAVVGDTAADVLIGLSSSAVGQGFTLVSITDDTLVISRDSQVLLNNAITTTDQTITSTFVIVNSAKTVRIIGGTIYLSLFTKGVQFYIYGNLLNVNPFTTVSAIVSGADLLITVESTLADETIATTLYFVNPINNSIPAYNSSSKENWGIVYYDKKGKTNGVSTNATFNVNTGSLGLMRSVNTLLFLTPYINLEIIHRPPLWATTYTLVRSANLTKQSWLFWVSGRTYKDDKYAYISIESINVYRKLNPNSIISYEFVAGDRIKFYVLYSVTAQPLQLYQDDHDYEIYAQVTNPVINNTVRQGTYIKIVLPTVDTNFNFSNGLTLDYCFYYLELYTPAKSAAEGLDVYYEFSEEFAIINPGTPERSHQGQIQNQSSNLVTPASFKFNKGDAYFRNRLISIGNSIVYDMVAGNMNSGTVLGQKLREKEYDNPDYIIKDVILQQSFVNNFNSPGWTINVLNNTYNFAAKGVLNFVVSTGSAAGFVVQVYVLFGTTTVLYQLGSGPGPNPIGTTVKMVVNTTVTMPPNSKAFVVINSPDPNLRVDLSSGDLTFSEPSKDFLVGVVDPNFSDFFESRVNSNGRALVVNPDEKTTYFSTLMRWGLPYKQNTNINQINRFLGDNFQEVDRAKGDIQRFRVWDRILRVFQNRAVGQFGIYAKYIQNNQGNPELVTTDEILTKNNINYYAGEFGLGDQYTSLVSSSMRDYFVDPVRGYQIRLSNDGFTPISELYKGQFYIRNLLTPYNKQWVRDNGGFAKLLGCYDFFEEQYVSVAQSGTEFIPDALIVTSLDIHNPVAVDDNYDCYNNETLYVDAPGIIANDTDDNPLTLRVQAGTFPTANGEIVVIADGAIAYTPDEGFVGTDTYEYTLINQYGLTDTANVNINVTEMEAGIIVMWSGDPNNVPTGWALCNGAGGTPDLSGMFIVGYDAGDPDYNAIGDTGGAKTVTLDITQIPAHTHPNANVWNESGSGHLASGGTSDEGPITDTTGSRGGGQAHENRPPYYTLAYIIKT